MELNSGANRHLLRSLHEIVHLSVSATHLSSEESMEMGIVCNHGFCHCCCDTNHCLLVGSVFTSLEAVGATAAGKLLVAASSD